MKAPQSPGPCPEAAHTEHWCQAWCLWLWPGSRTVTTVQGFLLLSAQSRLWELSGDLKQASTGNRSHQPGEMWDWERLHVFRERCWDYWYLAGNVSSGTFAIKSVLGRRGVSLPSLRPHGTAVAVGRSLFSTASGLTNAGRAGPGLPACPEWCRKRLTSLVCQLGPAASGSEGKGWWSQGFSLEQGRLGNARSMSGNPQNRSRLCQLGFVTGKCF